MPRTQSPIVLSQQKKVHLDKAEVVVLRDHVEDWKSVKGKERSRVLIAIYKEASLQAPTKDRAILKAWKKIYKQWLQNQSWRKKDSKPLIKYGRQETGEMAGSEEMISKWPRAAKSVIDGLSAEEREQVSATAERWNNQAVPPEVQAELAESKGTEMIEHFVTEMFKQAGMRHGIFMLEWGEYAGKQFDAEDGEEPQMVKSKKRQPRKLTKLEEDTNGWPMLPNTMGWNCAEQQHMIRSFLTKLYRMCGGEDTAKSAMPWGDVSKDPSAFFDGTNWPAGMQFKEPSKMDISDASSLLQFWWARQEQNIQTAFSFMVWQDSDGEICEAVVYPAPKQATMNGNRTQPTQQKGKYKGNVLPSRRTIKDSSSEDDELYGNDGHSSTAVSDVPKSEIATFGDTKEPARPQKKAIKQPSRPLAAVTRSKEVTYAADDLPRGSKHRAPEAVRDTPVKRTRSKTAAPEASLGKHGKK
ncbi:hypothetical protein EV424DRAFT_1545304 [Suillus variegatus]|nr:hypothetical protein EV424DRAFT_1545304 [Suillus variegatus]